MKSAIADYQKMYELDSTQKDVLMYIADCYQQLPDYEKAIEAYDTAARELPEYASAIAYARGVCYYSTEEFDKAVTDFLDYYSTDPDDGELNFLIGSCYMNLEKEADAKPYLLKALNGTSYLRKRISIWAVFPWTRRTMKQPFLTSLPPLKEIALPIFPPITGESAISTQIRRKKLSLTFNML